MKFFSPDKRTCVEVELHEQSDFNVCMFRVSLDGRVVISWSEVLSDGKLTAVEDVETRELAERTGCALATEVTVNFTGKKGTAQSRTRCIFRVADDCIAIIPDSDKLMPVPVLPPTLSCGYTPSVSKDGDVGYEIVGPAECRKTISAYRGLLFYKHGKCAAVTASCETGLFVMSVADRPASVILPRGMRRLLSGLPSKIIKRVNCQNSQLITVKPGDAEFNVNMAFLSFGFIFDAFRTNGVDIERALTTFYHLDRKIQSRFADKAQNVTSVHLTAWKVLTDPSFGEAASGFRGELGEYLCGARRNGYEWTVAGITSRLRVLTLFFPYLEPGVKYKAEWILDEGADLPTNAVNPTPAVVSSDDKAMVRMNSSGGFVLKLIPEKQ